MIARMDRNEQRILASIVRFIADDQDGFTDQELDQVTRAAQSKGADSFREMFDETCSGLPSGDDLDSLLERAADRERVQELISMAIELAQARVDLEPEDIRLLKTVAMSMGD